MRTYLAALLLAGCVTAPPDDGSMQITVTAEEAAKCVAAGGCGLMSHAEIANIQYQAYMLGQKEAFGSDAFDSHGCRKGDV